MDYFYNLHISNLKVPNVRSVQSLHEKKHKSTADTTRLQVVKSSRAAAASIPNRSQRFWKSLPPRGMRTSFSDPVEILPGIFRHIKFKTRYDADNTIKSYINTRANTAQKKIYNKYTKKYILSL
jgi:hypothetical protein